MLHVTEKNLERWKELDGVHLLFISVDEDELFAFFHQKC